MSNFERMRDIVRDQKNKEIIEEWEAAFWPFESMAEGYDPSALTTIKWADEFYTWMTCGCGWNFSEVYDLVASIVDSLVLKAKDKSDYGDHTISYHFSDNDGEGTLFFMASLEMIFGGLDNAFMAEHGSSATGSWLSFGGNKDYELQERAKELFIELWDLLDQPAEPYIYRSQHTAAEWRKELNERREQDRQNMTDTERAMWEAIENASKNISISTEMVAVPGPDFKGRAITSGYLVEAEGAFMKALDLGDWKINP